MQIVNANEVPWQRFSPHRGGFAENKRLLAGDPQSPDNFELSLVRVDGEYVTPRHRHNFDQVRYMVEGRFGVGPDSVLEEGTISYFPEGVRYTQQGLGTSVTLLLQFGGANGHGFMNYGDLDRGYSELCEKGEFSKGVYSWIGEDGQRHNADAYDAIWEHIKGIKPIYSECRYDSPIVMQPELFQWVASAEHGVEEKLLGIFSERRIGIAWLKVGVGATHQLKPNTLYHQLRGNGEAAGALWRDGTTVDPQGDVFDYTAHSESEFVLLDRPRFNVAAMAA